MLSNQSVNIHKLAAIEATAAFAFNWFKPKLCCASLALDVHMPWFASVISIKEKSVTALAQNGWHSPLISTVIPSEVENGVTGDVATWTGRPKAARAGGERIKSLFGVSALLFVLLRGRIASWARRNARMPRMLEKRCRPACPGACRHQKVEAKRT
jgi:hypothetical protein